MALLGSGTAELLQPKLKLPLRSVCFSQVLVEGGKAAGVVLRPNPSSSASTSGSSRGSSQQPQVIRARKGVISNASIWDTQKLLPQGVVPAQWRQEAQGTPPVSKWV
jgi:hypothetical protein